MSSTTTPIQLDAQLRQQQQQVATTTTTTDDHHHSQVVSSILTALDGREEEPPLLTAPEVTALTVLCAQDSTSSGSKSDLGFADVDVELVIDLVDHLETLVSNAVASVNGNVLEAAAHVIVNTTTNSNANAKEVQSTIRAWIDEQTKTTTSTSVYHTLTLGLQAAGILMAIVTSPGIDPRVMNEDAIGASIVLLRHHLTQTVLPAVNDTGHLYLTAVSSKHNKKNNKSSNSSSPAPPPSAKKRRRSSSANDHSSGSSSTSANLHLQNGLQHVYRNLIAPTLPWTILLLERMEALVLKNTSTGTSSTSTASASVLDDPQVLGLAAGAWTVLQLDAPHAMEYFCWRTHLPALQGAALVVLTALFQHHTHLRPMLLQDVFPVLLTASSFAPKLSTSSSRRSSGRHSTASTISIRPSSILVPRPLEELTLSLTPSSSNNGTIQVTTALLLSLVQSVVQRPQYQHSSQDPEHQDAQQQEEVSSGLATCQQVSDQLAWGLLQRCHQKGVDGVGASEYRPVLQRLIPELCTCWLLPEYPAAELLLGSLTAGLLQDLSKSLHPTSTTTMEATYWATAFDALGTIAAAEARILAYHREHPLLQMSSTTSTSTTGTTSSQPPLDHCYCRKLLSKSERDIPETDDDDDSMFVVGCDRCHTCFHGPCVGLSRSFVPEEWLCDACQLGRILDFERDHHNSHQYAVPAVPAVPEDEEGSNKNKDNSKNNNKNKKTVVLDESYCIRRLIVDYLAVMIQEDQSSSASSGVGTNHALRDAYRFQIAKWIADLQRWHTNQRHPNNGMNGISIAPLMARIMELWDDPHDPSSLSNHHHHTRTTTGSSTTTQTLNGMLRCLSEEGRSRMVVHLACGSTNGASAPLLASFRKQVAWIVKIMSSSNNTSAQLRKLSVKAIEKVTDADPQLMLYSIIKKAVSERFSDATISVREAAVSLVGTYVLQTPAVANAFHSAFLTALNDPGISVRKRTIRILQDLILSASNDHYYKPQHRAEACSVLLRRAADPKEDDGVRDLIHELFVNLWLVNGDAVVEQRQRMMMDTNTPGTTMAGEESLLLSPSNTSCVMEVDDLTTTTTTTGKKSTTTTPLTTTPAVHTATTTDGNQSSLVRSNPTSTTRKIRTTRTILASTTRSQMAAEQMIQVVQSAGTGDHLTVLLRELTSNTVGTSSSDKKTSERKRRGQRAQQQYHRIVSALLERLLLTEEQKDTTNEQQYGSRLVATLQTIRVMTDVAPSDVSQHLDTLLPFLQADNGVSMEHEGIITKSICDIISRLALTFDADIINAIGTGTSLPRDLEQLTYKFGPDTLSAAVRALCALAHAKHSHEHSPFRRTLLKLANTFYKYLQRYRGIDQFGEVKAKARSGVDRALCALGAICQYHEVKFQDLKEDEENNHRAVDGDGGDDSPAVPLLTWNNIPAHAEIICTDYLQKDYPPTKCAALRALTGLFIAHPRRLFALDQSGLVDSVMSSKADPAVQQQSLICWQDILLAEESRIESGEAQARMNAKKDITVSKKISGDQDGDATLFGGVLTSHADRLFSLTQCDDPKLRMASLNLVGHLLRQGQLNPMEAVPYLLALQGDIEQDEIRALALKLVMNEGEKRPDMLRQRICAGVKQAYAFQATAYPRKRHASALLIAKNGVVDCVFSSVFKECLTTRRKQRLGLFRNLLGLFELKSSIMEDPEEEKEASTVMRRKRNVKKRGKEYETTQVDIPLLTFTAQVLAHLPYTVASDPLYIIHQITSTIALQAGDLLDRLADFLRPHGLASDDELDETNAKPDTLESISVEEKPSREKEAAPLRSNHFDLEAFATMCGEAAALSLLLGLKAFLRSEYKFSESRILAYDPNVKKDRKEEKIVPKPCTTPIVSSVPLKSISKEKRIDLDVLIKQYAMFRRLMRTETELSEKAKESAYLNDGSDDEMGNTNGTKKRRRSSLASAPAPADEEDDEDDMEED